MKVLIVKADKSEEAQLRDYLQTNDCEVCTAADKQTLFQILAAGGIDSVLYCITGFHDFSLIRYINKSYPSIKVVIITDSVLCNTIDNVRYGIFSSLEHPYRLDQLNSLFVPPAELNINEQNRSSGLKESSVNNREQEK